MYSGLNYNLKFKITMNDQLQMAVCFYYARQLKQTANNRAQFSSRKRISFAVAFMQRILGNPAKFQALAIHNYLLNYQD
jgi:hypothetical protein